MRTFIGPDIILSDLTEGQTLFTQSESDALWLQQSMSRIHNGRRKVDVY